MREAFCGNPRNRGRVTAVKMNSKMRVVQANLQHASAAMAVLVKTLTDASFTIALIQEPYTGNDGK